MPPKFRGGPLHESFQQELKRPGQPIFAAEFFQARLWGPSGTVITADDRVFADLSPEFRLRIEDYDVFQQLRLGPIHRAHGTTFLLTAPAADVYAHWMMDAIPRLGVAEKFGIDWRLADWFFTPGTKHAFHRETLRVLGISESKWLPASQYKHVGCERLIACSLPGLSGNIPFWAVDFLRKKFLPAARGGGQRRLWISRGKAARRRIVNEKSLMARLADLGFHSVYLEDEDFCSQIGLFAEAEIVVGANGSSMFNAIFCGRGAKVVELFGNSSVNVCQWAASQHAGVDYAYCVGPSVKNHGAHPHEWDYRIDPDELTGILKDMGLR